VRLISFETDFFFSCIGSYLIPAAISTVNLISPKLAVAITDFEKWDTNEIWIKVVFLRLYLLKILSIIILITQYVLKLSGTATSTCMIKSIGDEVFLVLFFAFVTEFAGCISPICYFIFKKSKNKFTDWRLKRKLKKSKEKQQLEMYEDDGEWDGEGPELMEDSVDYEAAEGEEEEEEEEEEELVNQEDEEDAQTQGEGEGEVEGEGEGDEEHDEEYENAKKAAQRGPEKKEFETQKVTFIPFFFFLHCSQSIQHLEIDFFALFSSSHLDLPSVLSSWRCSWWDLLAHYL